MLVASKHKNQKIVWGLLSYTFEETPTTIELETILSDYQADLAKEIYLFKDETTENYIGLIGIEQHHNSQAKGEQDQLESIVIKHFSILPSHRNEGLGFHMFTELKKLFPNSAIIGSIETSNLVVNYIQKYNEIKISEV